MKELHNSSKHYNSAILNEMSDWQQNCTIN